MNDSVEARWITLGMYLLQEAPEHGFRVDWIRGQHSNSMSVHRMDGTLLGKIWVEDGRIVCDTTDYGLWKVLQTSLTHAVGLV
jgi:hypothetical protein